MSETIRQISIVILFGLAFFCLQVGVFLMSGLFGDEPAEKNALALVKFAQGMLEDIEDFNATSSVKLFMRIGINSGSLIAGVIGKTKFVYDIWGDTVNVAIKMEIKGKGEMKTYFLK